MSLKNYKLYYFILIIGQINSFLPHCKTNTFLAALRVENMRIIEIKFYIIIIIGCKKKSSYRSY